VPEVDANDDRAHGGLQESSSPAALEILQLVEDGSQPSQQLQAWISSQLALAPRLTTEQIAKLRAVLSSQPRSTPEAPAERPVASAESESQRANGSRRAAV